MNSNHYGLFGILVAFVLCFSVGMYFYSGLKKIEIETMGRNIENAIVKGIDPIAVKCSYSDYRDSSVCIAYALRKSPDAPLNTTKTTK